jgi:hypothetical protein
MIVLHLGVIDIPYSATPAEKRGATKVRKGKRPHNAPGSNMGPGKSTGDVAEILEDRYHVMEHFFEVHGQGISDALTEGLQDSLESRLSGAPPSSNPFASGEDAIRTMFNVFIDSQEMDGLGYPGIPTKASLKGVSHRLKHPYAKSNQPRPSFRDTGLYEQSFRSWVDANS